MTRAKVGIALAAAIMLAVPAMALPDIPTALPGSTNVRDPWDPDAGGDELNLFEIYNNIYGTSFTRTNGLAGDGGMEELQVNPDELFGVLENGGALFQAHYAGNSQRFGYYTNPGDGNPLSGTTDGAVAAAWVRVVPEALGNGQDGNFVFLFEVGAGLGTGVVNGSDPAAIPAQAPGEFIGFWDQSPAGSGPVWFSDPDRNADLEDHMVVYRGAPGGEVDGDLYILAFEDLPNLGDTDYNDLVIEVIIPGGFNNENPDDPIPEPATAGLLLMGLAGVALRRRFTA